MARWTDLMKLSHYHLYEAELQEPGVYEIGHTQNGYFYPKYIGKAENRLIDRIKTYGANLGKDSHNAAIRGLNPLQFSRLYFHVMRTRGPGSAGVREALLLIRQGRGDGMLYQWNNRYELQVLRDAGYDVW